MTLNEERASVPLTCMGWGRGAGNVFTCPCVFVKLAKEKYFRILFPKWIIPIYINSGLTNLDLPLFKGYIKT